MKKKGKTIVLLLGAGFPLMWGAPSSNELLAKIIEDRKYIYDSDRTWGKFLYDTLVSFYEGEENTNVNFETIIAALEAISNYYFAITNEGRNTYNTSLTPAMFTIREAIGNIVNPKDDVREYCFDMYKHFVQLILESIENYDNKVCEQVEINALFNKFIMNLMSKNYSIKIYSTNYDSVVPQIISNMKIYNGEQYRLHQGITYKPDYIRNRESRLSYFSLHGSIYWDVRYNSDYYYEVVKSSFVEGVKPLWADGGNPNEQLIFSPIIVGYTKTQRCMSFPFSIGFTNFINDCCDCDKILAIGYSFSDPHINTIIYNHINHRKVQLINIGLVEKNCNFDHTNEYLKISGFVKRIYKEKEDEEWFYGLNNEFLAYKKGTKYFLENVNNWKHIDFI